MNFAQYFVRSSTIFYRSRTAKALTLTAFFALTFTSTAFGQKFQYFGTPRSDWAVASIPPGGGQIRWLILRNDNPSTNSSPSIDIPWGNSATEFVPNPGDYTGDGVDDIAVYRDNTGVPPNMYIIRRSQDGGSLYIPWGNLATDFVGREGDYDGDGRMDPTAIRAPTETSPLQWWVLRSSDNTGIVFTFGNNATDVALPGADYNGDGKDDPTVARVAADGTLTWYVGTTAGSQIAQVTWGNFNTDFIVPGGDYDGDGKADFMVWRGFGTTADGVWYLLTSTGATSYTRFGIPGGATVRDNALRSGDYDGDGKTDIAIYRPSTLTYYVLRSSGGVQTQPWGIAGNGNVPIAAIGVF